MFTRHIPLVDWNLYHYIMTFFVPCYSLCFKVYFVWYKYCYPSFFLFPFTWNIVFIPSLTICVSFNLEYLASSLCTGAVLLIIKPTLCLLIGALSPFTFTIIIDTYVIIVILSIVNLCWTWRHFDTGNSVSWGWLPRVPGLGLLGRNCPKNQVQLSLVPSRLGAA